MNTETAKTYGVIQFKWRLLKYRGQGCETIARELPGIDDYLYLNIKTGKIIFLDKEKPTFIDKGKPTVIKLGDYIGQNQNGSFSVISEDEFKRMGFVDISNLPTEENQNEETTEIDLSEALVP